MRPLSTLPSVRKMYMYLIYVMLSTLLFPAGTGKGGKSIWGKRFPDELSPSLRVSLNLSFSQGACCCEGPCKFM